MLLQILHQGRQRKALLDAALGAFRALTPDDRMAFLVAVEAELVASPGPFGAPLSPSAPAPALSGDPTTQRRGRGRPKVHGEAVVKQVLDLTMAGLSARAIAQSTGVSASAVERMRKARRPVPPVVITPAPRARAAPRAPRGTAHDRAPKTKRAKAIADSEDSPAIYYREIGSHKLLTREEELALAQRLEDLEVAAWRLLLQGTCADQVRALVSSRCAEDEDELEIIRALRLTPDVDAAARALRRLDLDRTYLDAALAAIAAANDHDVTELAAVRDLRRVATQLREEFVRSNLRLVVSIARGWRAGGLPMADLIQEGNLGLLYAVPRFDHRRGLRFSTYATWQIRHAIQRACMDTARTVRIPVHAYEASAKIYRHTTRLTTELGRAPTTAELAAATALTERQLALAIGPGYWLTGAAQSLDAPIGPRGELTAHDAFVDPRSEDHPIVDVLAHADQESRLGALLDQLPPCEADLVRQRYGFGGDARTLKAVGALRGLSRERIRQLESGVLAKLRRMLEAAEHPIARQAP